MVAQRCFESTPSEIVDYVENAEIRLWLCGSSDRALGMWSGPSQDRRSSSDAPDADGDASHVWLPLEAIFTKPWDDVSYASHRCDEVQITHDHGHELLRERVNSCSRRSDKLR